MSKKEEFVKYFEEITVEDVDDIEIIGSMACRTILRDFGISFSNDENEGGEDEWRAPIVIFAVTYEAIIEELIRLRKESYNKFNINFANRFYIGFDNRVDEEDEKEGNFMIYIFNKEDGKGVNNTEENSYDEQNAAERCRHWVSENVIDSPDTIKRISENALKKLEKLDIVLYRDTLIPPIVSYVYDELIAYMNQKRINMKEDEFEINFSGCFFVMSRETKDGKGEIVFRPSIESKMLLKDDATSGNNSSEE